MTIQSITVSPWDIPMRAAYRSARRVTTVAHNVLVCLTLSDGTTGYGEASPAQYVTGETQESVVQGIRAVVPRILALPLPESIMHAVDTLLHTPGARGAVVMALNDALAKVAGVPLYRALGGRADAPLSMATDLSLPILPPDEAAVRAADAVQSGFHSLKLKVGSGDIGEDAARVRAVAQAAPQVRLRLDGNQGFTAEEAVRFIYGLSDLHDRLELLEQPTKAGSDAGDGESLRWVRERVPCPIFADESVHHEGDAIRLLQAGAIDGVVLKLAKSGLAGANAIARATAANGGTCLFGCMMETRLGIGASLHLALALGADVVPFLDLDGFLLVNDTAHVTGGFAHAGDTLTVDPHTPGIGATPILPDSLPHRQ